MIRINLLAEAQALEDMRRRDPVKRAIWAGSILVGLMMAWSSWLQLKIGIVTVELNHADNQIAAHKVEYAKVSANQKDLQEIDYKLGCLQDLATNRLLYGTLLNAMQKTAIDNVQLLRLRSQQSYVLHPAVKGKTNSDRIIPSRPASVTEKVLLTLDARDTGPTPGDQVNKYKKAVADSAYFLAMLGHSNEVRLTSLSPPSSRDGKPCVQFTLECRYPDQTR